MLLCCESLRKFDETQNLCSICWGPGPHEACLCTAEEASDLPFGRTLPPSARGENCRITWNSCSLLPWILPLDLEITLLTIHFCPV